MLFNHLHSWGVLGGDIKLGCSLTRETKLPSGREHASVWKKKNSSLSLSNLKPREGESHGTGNPADLVHILKPPKSTGRLCSGWGQS